ncbi:MAG: hypothetical protein JWN40_928 [Phycisphaerales bacterium]|nr:hypothetical protein [Phycisphaerales bacterium]
MGDELSANADDARCWSCGYLLRGVASGRCPECGRAFDLSDPKSVNFGRPMGRVGRWMLGDLGWSGVVIAFAGCAAILATTRWPVEGWRFSMLDLRYYAPFWEWRHRGVAMTLTDGAYTFGLITCAAVATWRMLRLEGRAFAVRHYRPPAFQRGTWGRSTAAMALLLVVGFIGVGVGWSYRLGQRWVATELSVPPPAPLPISNWPGSLLVVRQPPLNLAPDVRLVALRSAVRQGRTPRERVAAIKWLVEEQSIVELLPILRGAVADEKDASVRALEARLIGMTCTTRSIPTLLSLAKDGDATVRAAAADALGIWHSPLWPLSRRDRGWPIRLDTDPPITVRWDWLASDPPVEPAIQVRGVLERMMLSGSTTAEREAAARGIANWPLGVHFRYAEWGVFQADTFGRTVARIQDRLDEIPALAHRIPDLDAELNKRIGFGPSMPVWKPVIHLSSQAPLAVDIQVSLARGRPWVAYPMFDDLTVLRRMRTDGFPSPPTSVYTKSPASNEKLLGELREGYPWLLPNRRNYPWIMSPNRSAPLGATSTTVPAFSSDEVVDGVGVHWQSVIVSPTRLPWMTLAEVGSDPRFDWWKRLRDVDCSWVSSRGESERFLYYDGPVNRWAPVRVEVIDGRLQLTSHWSLTPVRRREPMSDGVVVSVTPTGVSTRWASGRSEPDSIDLSDLSISSADAAERDFVDALQKRGLTRSEADGLTSCWRQVFFRTPGRRYLHLMSSQDYDDLCPLVVRPEPSERIRVGVLWIELPAN